MNKLSASELQMIDRLTVEGVCFPNDGQTVTACRNLVSQGLLAKLDGGGYILTDKGRNTFNG